MTTKRATRVFAPPILTGCIILAGALSGSVAAQTTAPPPQPGLVVPGYNPGIAGNVSVGPTTPVCKPLLPCTRPLAGVRVEVLDNLRRSVASAVTNSLGNFLVSVPTGTYLVHIQVLDFPRCPEAQMAVGPKAFALVGIECDTGLR